MDVKTLENLSLSPLLQLLQSWDISLPMLDFYPVNKQVDITHILR